MREGKQSEAMQYHSNDLETASEPPIEKEKSNRALTGKGILKMVLFWETQLMGVSNPCGFRASES